VACSQREAAPIFSVADTYPSRASHPPKFCPLAASRLRCAGRGGRFSHPLRPPASILQVDNMVRTTQMVCTLAEAGAIVKAATPPGLSAALDRGRPDARALPTCRSRPVTGVRSVDRLHRWAEFP
jgi:hypothetical protein